MHLRVCAARALLQRVIVICVLSRREIYVQLCDCSRAYVIMFRYADFDNQTLESIISAMEDEQQIAIA